MLCPLCHQKTKVLEKRRRQNHFTRRRRCKNMHVMTTTEVYGSGVEEIIEAPRGGDANARLDLSSLNPSTSVDSILLGWRLNAAKKDGPT